jgi:hypothetical protein
MMSKLNADLARAIESKFQFAPFPYFGGKRTIAGEVWSRLGKPVQYIEPFCGSAAILLSNPKPASLEVVGDNNFYIANFWRAIKFQPQEVYGWQDYPVSHVDLDARHRWLTHPARTLELRTKLADPEWPGDARFAGWWVWGQCCWIGGGWCEKDSQIPHVGNAGRGVQSKIPHVGDAGKGTQSITGDGALDWFNHLAARLRKVRIVHGDWTRCLNNHYGKSDTAIFFDPPYKGFERIYHKNGSQPVADSVAKWAAVNQKLRIALCGHRGDYDLPGWEILEWSRGKLTYGGSATTDSEAIWFSPACHKPAVRKQEVFDLPV